MPGRSKAYVFNRGIDKYFTEVYHMFRFMKQFFKEAVTPPFHFREIINQCYEVGIKALPLISLTGFVTGIVFTKQSRPSLEVFGATSWLPSLISIAIVRALAALVTALICAGKVGSSIGAELGSMRVSEQIDAMEVSAINPFKFLVVSRVMATTFMVPILSFFSAFIGLLGSFANVNAHESTSFVSFFEHGFDTITFLDVGTSAFKSVVFGFTIGIVASYKGYHATGGTQGVGKAANEAVIISMFLLFIEEIVIVQINNWIRYY